MAAVRTIKEGMTYNPDTGNYHVRDAVGNFTGDTTDRDVAERWHASGHVAVMSAHAAVRAGDRAVLRALMAHVVWTQLWARRQCLPPYTRVTTRGFPS